MRNSAAIAILAAAIIALISPEAGAHGGEFLQAKVTFPGGEVQVDVTADYSGANPMIDSEAEAATAISGTLRVREGGASQPLAAFSRVRFSKPAEFDPSSPYAALPGDGSEPHRLLMATWRWKPSASSLVFDIPHGAPYDVVLWTVDERAARKKPRWLYLIADDSTPPIAVPSPPLAGLRGAGKIGVLGFFLAGPIVWSVRRRLRLRTTG